MTNRELKQLFYLRREMDALKERAQVLESIAEKSTANYMLNSGSGCGDRVGKYAVEIAAIKTQIEAKRAECIAETARLEMFIDSIDDTVIRQIMSFRHVSGYSWNQVAAHMGGGMTAESCRKAHHRFLQKH